MDVSEIATPDASGVGEKDLQIIECKHGHIYRENPDWKCPVCGTTTILGAYKDNLPTAIHFKGRGFYSTDNKRA